MPPLRLLVIDDSLTIRKLVEISFRGTSWDVEFAATGHDGATSAGRAVPDLILLDYVLPDMKGTDVCQLLCAGAAADAPIVIMSAKAENVRGAFERFPAVVDFVTKPFAAEDIVARAQAVAERVASPRPDREADFARKSRAAQAVYDRLKPRMARIPLWMSELGDESPGRFFAKKLLTPDVLDELVDALAPHLPREGAAAPASPGELLAEGDLSALPLSELLRLAAARRNTGELRVTVDRRTVVIYWRSGEIVMVTTDDPVEYAREAPIDASRLPRDIRERAEAEQRSSARPLYLTLAEMGALTAKEVTPLLREQGRRLLLKVLGATRGRFTWRNTPLPAYVDAHGRPVPVAQVELERLRGTDADADALARRPPAEAVLERAPEFSRKLRELDLAAAERRLLSLVDGRTTLARLSARADVAVEEAQRVLRILCEAGLVRERGGGAARHSRGGRPVVIWEPDVDGFQEPLGRLLRSRPDPLRLVGADGTADTLAALHRERPCLLIVNATAAGDEAVRIAREVSSTQDLADISLLAVLETPGGKLTEELWAAGFDGVVMKPLHLIDVERLLSD